MHVARCTHLSGIVPATQNNVQVKKPRIKRIMSKETKRQQNALDLDPWRATWRTSIETPRQVLRGPNRGMWARNKRRDKRRKFKKWRWRTGSNRRTVGRSGRSVCRALPRRRTAKEKEESSGPKTKNQRKKEELSTETDEQTELPTTASPFAPANVKERKTLASTSASIQTPLDNLLLQANNQNFAKAFSAPPSSQTTWLEDKKSEMFLRQRSQRVRTC